MITSRIITRISNRNVHAIPAITPVVKVDPPDGRILGSVKKNVEGKYLLNNVLYILA